LTGEPGASPTYTDLAIEALATVQAIYGLPGRQTQGFLQSVFELMKLDLPVPDHSTLSRRKRQLTISLPIKDWSKSRHLVVDSTGVKVYGEGEWKVRQHGISKRRTWRKLHFCTDQATLEIISVVASTNDVSDAEALPDLLEDAPGKIEQVSADGAYDQRKCYDTLNQHGAKAAIPPRKGAKIWQHANTKAERHVRDENLRRIRKVGRKQWKRESNYHRRSLAETQVFRFKTIFGDRLQTRQIDNQFKELMLKSAILNRMTHLGMPDSVKVSG
ncbi:MAG: IS5 family transposase, partial [Acidobacteria bacterium]|nr:IS5 family transposase [Acidobacteriota bacterium]